MLMSIVIQIAISMIAKIIFSKHYLSPIWDVFNCFQDLKVVPVVKLITEEEAGSTEEAAFLAARDALEEVQPSPESRPKSIP